MTGDIFIYGGIGTDRGEVSFDIVNKQIIENKAADELTVHIISPGGDVFEGEAIYNALLNTGKKITTHIEGTCASIATLIAGAGEKIIMNKTARFMIHNPKISGLNQAADSRELRHVANQLDKIKGLFMNVWDAQTIKRGKPISNERLSELYDNETWMTADEAQEMGFVDESVDAIKAVAKINLPKLKNDMKDESIIKNLIKRVQNGLASLKIKNEQTLTLQDGTKVIVLSDDGEFAGKQIMYESGEALPPNDYPLTDGRLLVVGDGGMITEVKEKAVDNKQDDMKKDEEIANLKAQLAEAVAKAEQAVAQVTTAKSEAVTAKADALKFQNKVTEIEKSFIALKEEALKTVGDRTEQPKGPVFKNTSKVEDFDPMGEEAMKYFKQRNLA
jgi:ATP-dependent protease ClpP protease subunit